MKCAQCGTVMKVNRENVKYDEMIGLPVMLADVEVRRCPGCGEYEVVIPRLEELLRVLAGAVIRRRVRLSGGEVRFLRKYLGWSGVDFARRMGTQPETVSRWEHAVTRIGPQADRLLRLMVATVRPAGDYSVDLLQQIGKDKVSRPSRWRFRLKGDHWQSLAA